MMQQLRATMEDPSAMARVAEMMRSNPQLQQAAMHSAEIKLIFELTGDFDLVSEPIVFVSRSIRNWYQI